ncbi:MAG: hypothetical protein L7S67_10775, partial [Flavobacteriales bacterium]|nr:hypothetical protein [Flavobacteriales bacterium]
MKAYYLLLALVLLPFSWTDAQVTLFSETFSDNSGTVNPQTVLEPGTADRPFWGISGPTPPNNSDGKLQWANAEVTCSWASQTVNVAGYTSLNLNVEMSEAGSFSGTDEVYIYVYEDGVERLISSQLGNDFESLSISNAACTASTSLQVLIMVRNDGYVDAVYLDEVSITGTSSFTDIDMDGVDDASDTCIDLDGDGTCDDVDSELMLMDEDFSSYAVGTGLGSYSTTDTDNEAGEAHIQGKVGAGDAGWALLGEEQKGNITVRADGGAQYLSLSRTGTNGTDTTTVTMMTRSFDIDNVSGAKVRVMGSETTDFENDDVTGGFVFYLMEDGVEREVLHVNGEFTSFDETIVTTAKRSLALVVKGYAMWQSNLRLEQVSVFGEYCQTGKDLNGDCRDIGCMDERACSYSALAITSDVTKCKYLGDACDDGDASNFSDRYENAGDGTCICEGFALQTVYLENFAANGEAQGGLDYGYDGALDLDNDGTFNEDNAGIEPEWSFDFEDANVGSGTSMSPSPFYFATKELSEDTVMRAFNTNGDYMRWSTRAVDVSNFDSLYVTGELLGLGSQATSDYAQMGWVDGSTLQSPLLAEITGVSSATLSFNEKVSVSSGSLSIRVEIENNTSGSHTVASHAFDDVGVYGLKRGCTDPDASNYDASPADGLVALSDDGSCEYDWATVYSRKDGLLNETIWAGKPCSEAGYTCNAASLYIDIHPVTESGTRHAVISANTKVTVPSGSYTLGGLTLESGAELVIPDGLTLTVDGDVLHKGGTVSGLGRLVVKGEMSLASGVTDLELHDFTFGVGGQLSLTEGAVLRIKGDLTMDDGSLISGKMELTGTSAQTVSGLDVRFDTLRIASAGVTFAADARISGVLDIDQGVVEMDGNVLTFSSDASGTGMLDMIANGASLEDNSSGSQAAANAIVKRYIAPDGDGVTNLGYTLFGSSLLGATMADFGSATDFYFSGVAGSDYPTSTSTVQFWSEKKGGIVYPTSPNTALDTLGGAWLVIYGSQTPTLHSSGTLRNHSTGGLVNLPVTRTPSSTYDGWNLVYNPYQAKIDWDEIADYGSNGTLVEDQYLIFDTQDRVFKKYSESTPELNSAPKYIMPGQGFWVKMNHQTDTTGTLTIPSAAIEVGGGNEAFIRSENLGDFEAQCVLELENEFGSGVVVLRIGDQGALEYVPAHDLSFRSGSGSYPGKIAVQSGDRRYSAKALPRNAATDLYVKSKANVATTMRVVGFTEGAEVCLTVTDTETGEIIVSRVGDEMTFTLPSHEAAEGRFVVQVVPTAAVAARPPSCPGLNNGRVQVSLGEEPANVLLTDGGDNVLDQIIGATGSAAFEDLAPGDYGLVVAGPGMQCGSERRSFTVMPGEQPELLGLDWEVPACNEGEVSLDFELYGNGDFVSSLRLGNEAVWSNVEEGGEVSLGGLEPGTYALEIEHLCLEETVVLDLYDPSAVIAAAEYEAMVIMDPVGGTALEAHSMCYGEETYRWVIDGQVVGQDEPLFYPVDFVGGHVVELEAWNGTCADIKELPFLVVNWNEAR